jgi:uncharacterized protein
MNRFSTKPVHQQISASIREQDFKLFCSLVETHPEFLEFDGLGGWLNYAADEGVLDIVKYLLSKGLDINKGDFEGVAPLCSAASGGHYETVTYLLDHGAKIDVSASVRNPLFAVITESVKQSMNRTWGPSTGEAPQIVRLLLERGLDSTVRYNTKTMKDMDAVAFATMMGAHDLAYIIALWNAKGDETEAQAALEDGRQVSHANVTPVPPDEQVAPS